MTERIPLLVDTDPGVDDALALLMAFADTRHEVVGLTIAAGNRSEEHTSELQSLMRISYAVFCLKKKTHLTSSHQHTFAKIHIHRLTSSATYETTRNLHK